MKFKTLKIFVMLVISTALLGNDREINITHDIVYSYPDCFEAFVEFDENSKFIMSFREGLSKNFSWSCKNKNTHGLNYINVGDGPIYDLDLLKHEDKMIVINDRIKVYIIKDLYFKNSTSVIFEFRNKSPGFRYIKGLLNSNQTEIVYKLIDKFLTTNNLNSININLVEKIMQD